MKKIILMTTISILSMAAMAQDYSQECPNEKKCTPYNLYVTAKQANDMKNQLGDNTLFVDVRSLEEINFVGTAKNVDAYIPYAELEPQNKIDDKKSSLILNPSGLFVEKMDYMLAAKQKTKETPIILICRSGERSARAAELLKKAGYSQVYSVSDGFEGDMSKENYRTVNGWKNSGLEWTYKIEKNKDFH